MNLHPKMVRLKRGNLRKSLEAVFGLALISCFIATTGGSLDNSKAHAGTVPHGDFMGATVSFNGVTESSTTDNVPLYGTPIAIGDTLSFFDPVPLPNPSLGFGAFSAGGLGDITDGFLSFRVMSKPGFGITSLEIAEGGDYSLDALGPALAKVTANLIVTEIAITHVDGVPINPIVKTNSLDTVSFEIPADPSVGLWDLQTHFDVPQLLNDAGVTFAIGATKITVKVNNTLSSLSQPGASGVIVKKSFDVDVDTEYVSIPVPEPETWALAMLGLAMTVVVRKCKGGEASAA
ncbi:MAG: PEP-CTERM sorting domain-containing protein [Planctomycetales bacterium]|nr:PEP-CTERM sorting domain-containing protein [Planctomycetales bacterium]